jgi:parallel beta-helix repeat protein
MKKLLFVLLCLVNTAYATNYYVSSSTGNDANAGTIVAPFKTLAKINTLSLVAGDSVLFKRGDVFQGKLIVKSSGNSVSRIIYAAYGVGAKPILSGFIVPTWTNVSSTIYEAPISNVVKLVTVANKLQQIGRHPNTGYLSLESYSGTTSITDNQLVASPNWTGADVVIRKNRWILDICKVTNHTGTVVTYTNPSAGQIPTAVDNVYTPKTGYGFFFQNNVKTLDVIGEWWYNTTTKKLQIYFGTTPTGVKVSVVDTIINCGSKSYLRFDNLSIEGGGEFGIFAKDGSNISVTNCDVIFNKDGINFWNIANSLIESNVVANCLNNGVQARGRTSGGPTVVRLNTIRNCGLLAGMGRSGDGYYIGIRVDGDNSTVEYNRVDSVGYLGIQFSGTNQNIRYNHVSNFCSVKDDGGGIYTYADKTKTNRNVTNNIVVNAIGAPAGTNSKSLVNARGIYLDGESSILNVIGNTVVNCGGAGLYFSNSVNVRATGNIVFNAPIALSVQRFPGLQQVRTNIFTGNIFYPNTNNFFYWNGELNVPTAITIQNDLKAIAKIDSNYYRTDLTAQFDWYYHLTNGGTFVDPSPMNLSQWKTYTLKDSNAVLIPTNSATICQYNPTSGAASYSLSGTYKDVKTGTLYTNSITLAPYTGAVLQKQATLVVKSLVKTASGYPNPATDVYRINIFSQSFQTGEMSVFDVMGRIIYDNRIQLYSGTNTVELDVSEFTDGFYTLTISLTSIRNIYKFIKNRK